uniref:Uncharacterized protein n=1 Tax=Arundo donax TaxID=35708 RepID=A0A0A9D419_ARUDO
MRVVPTRVHLPRVPALVLPIHGLLDGQRVHVSAERDDRRAPGADGGDEAGARERVAEPDPHGFELVADEAARLHLLVRQLGPLVDPAPHPAQPRR